MTHIFLVASNIGVKSCVHLLTVIIELTNQHVAEADLNLLLESLDRVDEAVLSPQNTLVGHDTDR
eukprot:2638080-Ditylum_brightwellii.AAC.1